VKDIEDAIAITLASYSQNGIALAKVSLPRKPPSNLDPRLATHECTWIRAC